MHAPPAAADPLLGKTIGSFRLLRCLGKGGMGSVYLGEHVQIGSKVAVKVLMGELARDPAVVARFYAEARAVNLIGHENIVSIFDINVAPPDCHYYVMEFLDGQLLTALTGVPVAPAVAIPILAQICAALRAAHAAGVVHRDLKPDNIFLIRRSGVERFVKVVDFGVAKLLETRDADQTGYGMAIGTPLYMAPEQWGGADVDGRADLYAVGVLAYLLATGRTPFPRGSMVELLHAHREQVPVAPYVINPQMPRLWSDVIMRALNKRPVDRFADAGKLAMAFNAVLGGPPPEAARPATQPGAPSMATPAPIKAPSEVVHGRETSRATTAIRVAVLDVAGKALFPSICTDLSRGGMFLCHEGAPPPIFSKLKVRLELPGRPPLESKAEVVRHVSATEAAKWNMAPGFGVQFVEVEAQFRTEIAGLMQRIRAELTADAEAGMRARSTNTPAPVSVTATPAPRTLGPAMPATPAPSAMPMAFGPGPSATPSPAAAIPMAFGPGPTPAPSAMPMAFGPGPTPAPSAMPMAFGPGPGAGGRVPTPRPVASSPTPPPIAPMAFGPGPSAGGRVPTPRPVASSPTPPPIAPMAFGAGPTLHPAPPPASMPTPPPIAPMAWTSSPTPPPVAPVTRTNVSTPPSAGPTPAPRMPPTTLATLDRLRRTELTDCYALLNLPLDADFGDVSAAVERRTGELKSILELPLAPPDRTLVDGALRRVAQALDTLGTQELRLSYDAARRNFRGVARCIFAGVERAELDQVRAEFLEAYPEAARAAELHASAAAMLERGELRQQALEEYEKALALDPLNLDIQRPYWALRRGGGDAPIG